MALRTKVLQKKAEKFEVKKLQSLSVTKERVSSLEPLLEEVYANRRPKPTDYEKRRDLIHIFNDIAKEICGNSKNIPVVVEFGSFVMDLFSPCSDLDLSVNFSSTTDTFPRERKIQTLRKFAKKLYAIQSNGHVSGVLPITSAKVPILKCVDRGTGVECDISVENRDGILKSHIIRIISSIDERFQKLSFLMKVWAKANNINSSKDKTLNSLSIILLVAFHFQNRKPPILPPFSDIFKDGVDPAQVAKSVSNFANYGERNKESLAELFVTLLIKLSSVEKLWAKGLCASTRNATWISQTWNSKVANISVEDFTDPTQNVARAVGQGEVKQIYKCIDLSIRYIFAFMDGHIGVQLKDLLFGNTTASGSLNLNRVPALPGIQPQAKQTKAKQTKGKRKKQAAVSHGSAHTESILHVESYAGIQTGSKGKLELAKVPNPAPAKKMRIDEGWRGISNGGWGASHAAIPSDATRWQQCVDWRVTQQPGSWEGTQRPPSGGGWGGSRNLEDTVRPSTREWGGSEQSSTVVGRGGTQLANGSWGGSWQQSIIGGVWRGNQQQLSWKESRKQSSWGGSQPQSSIGGGWNGTTGGGWRGNQQQSSIGCGWNGTTEGGWRGNQHQAIVGGGWNVTTGGGWRGNPHQSSIGGGWNGATESGWRGNPHQSSIGGGWNGATEGGWRGNQQQLSWGGSQQPGWRGNQQFSAGGSWGGTQPHNIYNTAGGWGKSTNPPT